MTPEQKQEIIDRKDALRSFEVAYRKLHNEPNREYWFSKLLEKSYAEADNIMGDLETVDSQEYYSNQNVKDRWAESLKKDLAENKISESGLLEALVRKVILDDPSLADGLKTKLQEINTRNPRP